MLNDFIMVIDDLISKEDCEQYIEWIEHYISHSVMLKESDKLHDRDHFTMNFNNHYSYDLLSGDNLSIKFLPSISASINDYLKQFSVLGRERLLIYDTKVKKIPIGGGFHNWHYENSGLHTSHRRLVIQLYLNTIDEGGETEFLYINKRIQAKEGSLIIFPSGYTHTHRGNPPIGGTKYIIGSWGTMKSNDNDGEY